MLPCHCSQKINEVIPCSSLKCPSPLAFAFSEAHANFHSEIYLANFKKCFFLASNQSSYFQLKFQVKHLVFYLKILENCNYWLEIHGIQELPVHKANKLYSSIKSLLQEVNHYHRYNSASYSKCALVPKKKRQR